MAVRSDWTEGDVLTIPELYARASHAVVETFPAPVRVRAELRRLSASAAGHRFLELVEPGGARGGRDAMLKGVVWASDWAGIEAQLSEAGIALDDGRVVVLEGRVRVYEAAGTVQLHIQRLDVDATVGALAAARRRLVAALVAEGIADANRNLPVPPVPLRVGVVSGESAQGARDLLAQLEASPFRFEVLTVAVSVQGPAAPREVAEALDRLGEAEIDVVAVVRGGGARSDLACFDDEAVARAVATCPVPVWTGIGHTDDASVADRVAQRRWNTPTEVGRELVTCVSAYADRVAEVAWRIAVAGRRLLDDAQGDLRQHAGLLTSYTRGTLETAAAHVEGRRRELRSAVRGLMHRERDRLEERTRRLQPAARRALQAADAKVERRVGSLDRRVERALAEATRSRDRAAAQLDVSRLHDRLDLQRREVTQRVEVLRVRPDRRLAWTSQALAERRRTVFAHDPARQLSRGWTLTRDAAGALVRDVSALRAGDELVTTFASGEVTSTVERVSDDSHSVTEGRGDRG